MRLRDMSFGGRLTVVAAGAVAAAIVALSALTWVIVRGELRGEVDSSLRLQADRLQQREAAPPDAPSFKVPPPPGAALGGARGYVQIVGSDGRMLRPGGAETALPVSPDTLAVAGGGRAEFLTDATVDGTHVRILTVAAPEGGLAVQIARPLTETDRILGRLAWVLVAICAGGVAIAAVAGRAVARSALTPVQRLTNAAEHVAATQDLSQRIHGGRDELGRLAGAFNRMLDALLRSRRAQRQLVADASHELRTPLTSVRANLELLASPAAERLTPAEREALLRDLVQQSEELSVLVGDLVDLARDGDAPAPHEAVRLDEAVRAAVERVRPRAPEVPIEVGVVEPAELTGDAAALERAVVNLIDNAVKFSPPGTPVEVSLHGGRIAVRDHGPGIADAELQLVFDRFYRADGARQLPGSGLGLAIVRQVAEAHGGNAFAQHAPGGGALLVMTVGATALSPAAASLSESAANA
jgi:two-component system sensor histidine kinase MprB